MPWHSLDAVLLESHFPDTEGFDLIERLQAQLGPSCPPIIVIDHDDVNLAVRFMKVGAADYLAREQIAAETLINSLPERDRAPAKFRQAAHRRRYNCQSGR